MVEHWPSFFEGAAAMLVWLFIGVILFVRVQKIRDRGD
jgi:hypothetical protein